MSPKIVGSFLALAFCLCGAFPVHAQNSENHIWINPAYKNSISQDEIPLPTYSRRTSRQFTCTSETAVANYLQQNFQARNIQINFIMDWDFDWSEVDAIYSRAREQATDGDDYLEYSIIGESRSYSGVDGYAEIALGISYVATYEEEQQVDQRVDEILATIIDSEMDVEAKEKAIHDWIVANVQYDLGLAEYSAYAALFLGKTVCQGYALLMHQMLEKVGISSRIVRSDTMGHAWNMVNLCGTWYHVDATWDDPTPDVPGRIFYTYFNLSDDELGQSHNGWTAAVPDAPEAPISYVEGVCDDFVEELTWVDSKFEAMSLALAQGKKVLLMAGSPSCSNCQYMKDTVCESSNPPIHDEILEGYIPWFSDWYESEDYYPYTSGLSYVTFPMICRIDPAHPDEFIDRTTGVQQVDDFYNRLRSIGLQKGDVNRLEGIDLQDAILALQTVVGISSGDVFADADVNGDKRIGIIDAVYILQKVASLR